MRHHRSDIARMSLDGTDLALAYGDVLVVEQANSPDRSWECVVVFLGDHVLEPAVYHLTLRLLGGAVLTGDAILVRTSERMAVLRGAGPLDGADALEYS